MERKQKEQIIIVVTIIALVLMFIGISYAFFTSTNNERSGSSIVAVGGKMLIEYADKTDVLSLTKQNIEPSNDILIDKTFTLTGINTVTADDVLTMPFAISLEYQNTFQNYELIYFIKRMDENENIVANIIGSESKESNFPNYYFGQIENWSGNTHTQEIANGYFKPSSDKQTVTFNLKMMFPDTGRNQNYNKGAIFNGKIVINSTKLPSVTVQIASYLDKLDKEKNSLKNDNTIDSNLRYVGENPNNYVSFNNELWRIVGNFNVYNTETNQNEILTKIVSSNSIGTYAWDSNGIAEWNQASLMSFLNKKYMNAFTTSGLSASIANIRWNLGSFKLDKEPTNLSLYNAERGTDHITNPSDGVERQDYWDGKIGLLYASDIFYSENNDDAWLPNDDYWTLTSFYNEEEEGILCKGCIPNPSESHEVYPSLYLKSGVKIESGTGTYDDPYILTYESSGTETPSSSKISDYIASLDKTLEGLEIDDTNDKNLRYVGENPDNYIGFNQEMWRIIGTFNVYNPETNQNEVLTKIIRYNSIGSYAWDTSETTINNGYGVNEWSQADLMTKLNTDYLGISTTNSLIAPYEVSIDSNSIQTKYIDKIAKVRWNLGGIDIPEMAPSSNNNTNSINPILLTTHENNTSKKTYEAKLLETNNKYSTLNIYNAERGTTHVTNPTDGVERQDYWDGKVALMYPSDYGYASINTECRLDITSTNCQYSNWLYKRYNTWTLSSNVNYPMAVASVRYNGAAEINPSSAKYAVYPVVYLRSDVLVTGGMGTKSSPYLIDGDTFVYVN